jgi:hypothetical protein
VPRHVARLVTRLVAPLVVDYSASPRLVVDYSTAHLGASARRAALLWGKQQLSHTNNKGKTKALESKPKC